MRWGRCDPGCPRPKVPRQGEGECEGARESVREKKRERETERHVCSPASTTLLRMDARRRTRSSDSVYSPVRSISAIRSAIRSAVRQMLGGGGQESGRMTTRSRPAPAAPLSAPPSSLMAFCLSPSSPPPPPPPPLSFVSLPACQFPVQQQTLLRHLHKLFGFPGLLSCVRFVGMSHRIAAL